MNDPGSGTGRLVVTADDVGFTRGINDGVEELLRAGRLLNLSLMVNAPAFDHAVDMLKRYPKASCGLHFNIFQGKPLTDNPELAPLLDSSGSFIGSLPGVIKAFRGARGLLPAVKKEMEAQLAKMVETGLKPSHIDIHKFLAYTPVIELSAGVATENGIPFIRWSAEPKNLPGRFGFSRAYFSSLLVSRFAYGIEKSLNGVRKIPCTGIFCIGEWKPETMEAILAGLKEDAVEIVMHPGRVSGELKNSQTRLVEEREKELEILLSDEFGRMLDKYGWRIAGFGDL